MSVTIKNLIIQGDKILFILLILHFNIKLHLGVNVLVLFSF